MVGFGKRQHVPSLSSSDGFVNLDSESPNTSPPSPAPHQHSAATRPYATAPYALRGWPNSIEYPEDSAVWQPVRGQVTLPFVSFSNARYDDSTHPVAASAAATFRGGLGTIARSSGFGGRFAAGVSPELTLKSGAPPPESPDAFVTNDDRDNRGRDCSLDVINRKCVPCRSVVA